MKQIVSGKDILAAINANQKSGNYDWVLKLIGDASLKMLQERTTTTMILVPEFKKNEFGRLIKTEEVKKVLNANGFRIIETDYDNFYLNCKSK